MSFLKQLTESGTAGAESPSEKRNLILCNSISLVVTAAPLLLVLVRIAFSNDDIDVILHLLAAAALFASPLFLNRLQLIVVSRIALCWLPPIIIIAAAILDVHSGSEMSASSFVGLRLFILTASCFPFLVFNLKDGYKLVLALSANVLALLFFDRIFEFFNAAYWQHGPVDPLYAFNDVRAMVSFIAIGLSCFLLKRLVEKNESINEELMAELEVKNKVIREQADNELQALNDQLTLNLHQLQERESSLNQSQKIAKIGSWEYLVKDSYLFCSDEIYNIFGLDKSYNFQTDALSKLLQPADSEILNQSFATLIQDGTPFDLTVRARTPLGHTKWVRVNALPLWSDKRVEGARGICHDITYFREADELLRMSENKYRSLFEQASDFIFTTDLKGRFIDANESTCITFGYSRADLRQMKIEALIDPVELENKPIHYQRIAFGDHILTERRMMRKDGVIIVVEANIRKVQDDVILVIARDITGLRNVQRQIAVSEALFRSAFEDSAIGMALVSPDYKWIKVNPELSEITGYSELELLGVSIAVITHPDDAKDDLAMVTKLLKGERDTFKREKRYIHKDGSVVWANVNASLVKDNAGHPLYMVAQIEDITQRKSGERQLAEANKTIGELKLMALRAVMSPHFIFNVLNSIQYYITKSDRYNAINYLSMFSRLIRSILTQSADNKIRLSEEIEMLGNYIRLEMTRFENKFNYLLIVDPRVEADSIQIPSLLIQPYVENAILHGLYNKKEKGNLLIRIRQEEETLIFEVEDDGVGRAAASKIREQNFPKHKSMGISLTEERLKLINQEQPTSFSIEDLIDGNVAVGTRVTIRITI